MSYEIIPQAPNYEMNGMGIVRNRKTGRIRKWTITNSGIKRISFWVGKKNISLSYPYLMWQLHGEILSKVRPVPVVATKGTRTMRFDSLNRCVHFLADVTPLTVNGIWHHIKRRHNKVADWDIHYCY